jgi:protein-tyrosine phosphatase
LYQIIEGNLATEGIQQFSYQFYSEGNYQPNQFTSSSWAVVDVRDLYDGNSFENNSNNNNNNTLEDYERKIDLAWEMMQKYGKVVICCVAGISRSNAIAIGVLVKYFKMPFGKAWKLVHYKVPIAYIQQVHVTSLKELLGVAG